MTYQPGGKYILYLPSAVEAEARLDGSFCHKLESIVTKFQGDWGPGNAFAKDPEETGTEHIYQIKHERGVLRGFASWWNVDSKHVLCLIDVFKKAEEDDHWGEIEQFNQNAERIHNKLDELHEDGVLEKKLSELNERDDHKVIPPE